MPNDILEIIEHGLNWYLNERELRCPDCRSILRGKARGRGEEAEFYFCESECSVCGCVYKLRRAKEPSEIRIESVMSEPDVVEIAEDDKTTD